jgi:hypothetical protein
MGTSHDCPPPSPHMCTPYTLPIASSEAEALLLDDANTLLQAIKIDTLPIRTISELVSLASSMFVAAFESVFTSQLEGVRRQPATQADYIYNADVVLHELRKHLPPNVSIPTSITGKSLCDGEVPAIRFLVAVFLELHRMLAEYTESNVQPQAPVGAGPAWDAEGPAPVGAAVSRGSRRSGSRGSGSGGRARGGPRPRATSARTGRGLQGSRGGDGHGGGHGGVYAPGSGAQHRVHGSGSGSGSGAGAGPGAGGQGAASAGDAWEGDVEEDEAEVEARFTAQAQGEAQRQTATRHAPQQTHARSPPLHAGPRGAQGPQRTGVRPVSRSSGHTSSHEGDGGCVLCGHFFSLLLLVMVMVVVVVCLDGWACFGFHPRSPFAPAWTPTHPPPATMLMLSRPPCPSYFLGHGLPGQVPQRPVGHHPRGPHPRGRQLRHRHRRRRGPWAQQ